MREQSTLATMPGEILNRIFKMLQNDSPRSLRALELASKFYKEAVEPTSCHQLSLDDNVISLKNMLHTQRMVHRLLDPDDRLSHHVRDLRISNFNLQGECLNALTLEQIVCRLFRLRSFSWDCMVDIPENLITRLEHQWPEVKLIAPNHDRASNDMRLLRSPLLHSLRFGIFNTSATVGLSSQLEFYSKLPELKEIILNAPGLKKLDIRFRYHWMGPGPKFSGLSATPHVLNMAINPSDQLPSLHELTFSGPPNEAYEFDRPHCELLRHCMDWGQLRRLNIGISCPQYLFEEIGGSISTLKSLTMGVRVGNRKYWRCENGPMTCENLEAVTKFIGSVPGLHELIITDLDDAAEIIASSIISTQKSLRKLSYLASLYRQGWLTNRREPPSVWGTAQLMELKNQCPALSHLEINIPLEKGRWSEVYTTTLSTFKFLNTLKVVVELSGDASDFGLLPGQDNAWGVSGPPFDDKLGREVAIKLWRSFFLNDPFAWLTNLTVCFTRLQPYDRTDTVELEYPIRIKRHERNGATIESPGKWKDRMWEDYSAGWA